MIYCHDFLVNKEKMHDLYDTNWFEKRRKKCERPISQIKAVIYSKITFGIKVRMVRLI